MVGEKADLSVCSASNDLPAAEQLASGLENVSAVSLDAGSEQALSDLVASADVVLRCVSLAVTLDHRD